MQSSQKQGVSYLQVLENGIHCLRKNQEVAHKNPCYQLLTKFRSGNPGPVLPHSTNQLASRRGCLLRWGLHASLGHSPCPLPGPGRAGLRGQLVHQRAMLCAMQAQFLLHFEFCLLELMAKKNSGDT